MAAHLLNLIDTHSERHINSVKKQHEHVKMAIEAAIDIASELTQHGGDEQASEDLKATMLQYLKMEKEMNDFMEAVEQTRIEVEQLGDEVKNSNLTKMMEDKLSQVDEVDIDHLRTYKCYKDLLNALNTDDGGHSDQDDVDIVMTQDTVNTLCPITRTVMTDPVSNRHCGHTYDRAGILQLIKNRRHKARCPIGGCDNKQPISEADLQDNRDLKRFIDRQKRGEIGL